MRNNIFSQIRRILPPPVQMAPLWEAAKNVLGRVGGEISGRVGRNVQNIQNVLSSLPRIGISRPTARPRAPLQTPVPTRRAQVPSPAMSMLPKRQLPVRPSIASPTVPRRTIPARAISPNLTKPAPVLAAGTEIPASKERSILSQVPTGMPQAISQQVSRAINSLARNPTVKSLVGGVYDMSRRAIHEAAREFGVDPGLMEDIAYFESGLNPEAKNPRSSAAGLFQFIDASWKQVMRELGLSEATSKLDPIANARAAAWALSKGRLSWWNESKPGWQQFLPEGYTA